jgi:hypothetical protein
MNMTIEGRVGVPRNPLDILPTSVVQKFFNELFIAIAINPSVDLTSMTNDFLERQGLGAQGEKYQKFLDGKDLG